MTTPTDRDLAERRHILFTMLTLLTLQLTRYDGEGWRATFFPEGRAHSITAADGSAWEREPRVAMQRAAWDGLRKREGDQA